MGVKFSNTNPAAPGGMTLATIQKDPATGEISIAVAPGGGGSSGGVNEQTVNYLIVSGDAGKIVVMNGTSLTATLPASAPSSSWSVWVANISSTNVTIARNGHTIDGQASDLTLGPGQAVYISTDGTNWFTGKGLTTDANILLSAVTTNDVSITKHGFAPTLPNDATKFFDGTGAYSVPAGTGITKTGTPASGNLTKWSGTNSVTNGDLSGDVTTGGTLVAAVVNLPNGVTQAGKLVATAISAPATPSAGLDNLYVDSTDKRFHDKNDAGTIGTTVVADTGATHNFLKSISAAGVIAKGQPSFDDLSVATGDITFSTAAAAKLTSVKDPTSAQDAATKNYVDTNAPSILDRVDLTTQSASIGATNLIASAAAGLYRISYYLNVTQAATTSSSILLTLSWTDGSSTVQSFSTPAIVKNTVGYFISDSVVVESKASVAMTYATTYASVGGTALNYSLRVHVELI